MSNWQIFPKKAWSPIGKVLSGFGNGEGVYKTAYAINADAGSFLNGRVSAYIRIAGNRPINGAGVICRANKMYSFVAFHVVTDDNSPDLYSVRLVALKYGKIQSLVGLKHPISIPNRQFHISLQFFSGEMIGEVVTETETHTLTYLVPELPFPGNCGVVRFYGSSVTVQKIQVEEIKMKPILPEEDKESEQPTHPISVFLSHSSADKKTVLKVIEAFKNANISYWVDHEQIKFGDGIVAKIEEGLQKSKYVVVCLSEKLITSGWCRAEYGAILYREFSGDTSRRVIPLSLDGSNNSNGIPLLLSDKLRADFTNQNNFSEFIQFLHESSK
ncbi:toll/interleukin-1 receptor domain-containing protein [Scytonema sp. PRP1]|uniref:toll/interleukin-1 receptor domain-containing protein n=1 Tax=Scytonema sp. PRP1 TaxID=3120513 RepID=UPI002FCF2CA9